MSVNEVKRIIENYKIDKSFLAEEMRNDFLVDSKRKKIWLIELDLLNKLNDICNKYHLQYWLVFGSLLGAVRHKGFIPWDDDLDVVMPRKDYDMLKNLSNEFLEPYFLQNEITDGMNGYYYSYMKIRNSNTSSISKNHRYQRFNMGIALDVFCLDEWDLQNGESRYNKIKELIIDNSNLMRKNNPNLSLDDLKRSKQYSGADPYLNLQRIEELAKGEDEEHVCIANLTLYDYRKNIFKKEWFKATVEVPFEYMLVPIPIGYTKILETIYGDYSNLPPENERGNWHTAEMNPDIPYMVLKKRIGVGNEN